MGKIKNFASSLAARYNASPLKKIINPVVIWGALLSFLPHLPGIYSAFASHKSLHEAPERIEAYYTKSEFQEVVAYSGEIRNDDDSNADDFSFKGKFKYKVAKFEVNTPDVIEKKDGTESGVVQFLLKRLSKGNRCEFDILVAKGNEKVGEMQISWKGGKKNIDPKEMDRNFERGIMLGESVRSLNLSQNARKKWVDNNTKSIGVIK